MSDINLVILKGTVDAEPSLKTTQKGMEILNIRLKTTERWTYQGKEQERPEWTDVAIMKPELVDECRNVRRGDRMTIQGQLQTSVWGENKENKKVRVVVNFSGRADIDGGGDNGAGF